MTARTRERGVPATGSDRSAHNPARRIRARLTWLAGPLLAAILLQGIACGGSTSAPAAPTPSLPAAEVVEKAASAMAGLSSFRFKLSHPRGATHLAGGLTLERADGSVVAPESYEITAEATLGRSLIKLSAIVIGADTYITNPLTGAWIKASGGESPLSAANPSSLIAEMLRTIENPEFAPEAGSGKEYSVRGTAPAAALQSLVGATNDGRTVEVLLAVDAGTFNVKRVRITGGVTDDEPPDPSETVREFQLFDFNSSIRIRPPL